MASRILVCMSMLICAAARADVTPAALFSDHMVLQQNAPVPVWGWADAGEKISVSINGQTQSATTDADGRWNVRLDALASGASAEMTIAGKNTVTIKDILIGEVWLASGQSNMDFTVSKKVKSFAGTQNEEQEIAAANFPQIRMFTVKLNLAAEPAKDVQGEWKVCSPETVPGFSAVGYFFARELLQSRKIPVGIITSTWGASTAQCWISKEALAGNARFKPILDNFASAVATFEANHPTTTQQTPPAESEPTTRSARPRGPRDPRQDQHSPYLLWNGMIKPIEPYAMRGAIWYQGESVVGGNDLYLPLMQTLISSWRREWGMGDFPFLFVQLANYKAPATQPAQGGSFVPVREAQLQTLAVPNTAMAVAIDIGDAKSVHPKNKPEVGRRLALAARAIAYGEKIEFSGPIFEGMSVEKNAVRLRFKHIEGGLKCHGDSLVGFAIAGQDHKFHNGDAKIDGDTVIVTSSDVAAPASVRYGWADNPGVNLYNGADLPASPFRTDEW